MKIELENGKYTYYTHPNGESGALRFGNDWRDLTGDKFVHALADKVELLQNKVEALTDALNKLTGHCCSAYYTQVPTQYIVDGRKVLADIERGEK